MTTTRSRVLLVVALVAASGIAGCKKSKKEDEPKQQPAAQDDPVSSELKQVLGLMPKDSDMIVGLDVASLRTSEFYKAYEKQLEDLGSSQLKLIRDNCGFDPVAKMSKVVVSGKGTRRKGDLTAIGKGLGKAETMACLAKPFPDVRITVDGDYALIEQLEKPEKAEATDDKQAAAADPKAGKDEATAPAAADKQDPKPAPDPAPAPAADAKVVDSLALRFIDDTTVVIARRGGKAVDKATMDTIVALPADHSVTGSPNFMQMLDGIDTDAQVWLVVNGAADSLKDSPISFLQFQAAFGHVKVGSGVTVDATLRLESEAKAAELAKRASDQIARLRKSRLKEALGTVEFSNEYNDVRVHVEQTRPQMDALIEQLSLYLAFF